MAWLIRDLLFFTAAVGGLAAPWLPLLKHWPRAERLSLALGLALIVGYLGAFAVYLSGADLAWFWVFPGVGCAIALVSRGWSGAGPLQAIEWADVWRWAILAGWCLGWHVQVASYSGAAWGSDWIEHYDRAQFHLAHWPRDSLFLNLYPLTARPPLVNVWSAALMSGGGGAFFHHQLFMTLLGTLVFFPLAALVRGWSNHPSGQAILLISLMASPMLVQNATFPWTKLTAAFFVLIAWLQLSTGRAAAGPARWVAAALALAGGMLAHYSVGPWICAFALAWVINRRSELTMPGARREAIAAALLALCVLLPWIAWAVAEFGWASTFLQNTAVAIAPSGSFVERLGRAGMNLVHTLWPVSVPGVEHPALVQTSALGMLRDWWFILYQLKLWWGFGSIGAVSILWLLWSRPPGPARRYSWYVVLVAIVLGTATHAQPDVLGLAHVALQPLVYLGLAWLAANCADLPRWLARTWVAGLLLDFTTGIALHFVAQSSWFVGALQTAGPPDPSAYPYTVPAFISLQTKSMLLLEFLSDRFSPAWGVGLTLVAAAVALYSWRRTGLRAHPPAQVSRRPFPHGANS